ncbi:hypothetical protein LMG27177_03635 [Paraburkholderia fynbosensis]|uniref:Uncharacterized protein n=1 Tax=Paraburkholderia fynbosensis TaxID=1200993 RepID=A0A6J5G9W7_9BURK|nr:hypothetical protein LMG27177_03635 [Paraburkholderia fynbosensis]
MREATERKGMGRPRRATHGSPSLRSGSKIGEGFTRHSRLAGAWKCHCELLPVSLICRLINFELFERLDEFLVAHALSAHPIAYQFVPRVFPPTAGPLPIGGYVVRLRSFCPSARLCFRGDDSALCQVADGKYRGEMAPADNSELQRPRGVHSLEVLRLPATHVKLEWDFKPRQSSSTQRVHVNAAGAASELLVDSPMLYGAQEGGVVDLVMYLWQASSTKAIAASREAKA